MAAMGVEGATTDASSSDLRASASASSSSETMTPRRLFQYRASDVVLQLAQEAEEEQQNANTTNPYQRQNMLLTAGDSVGEAVGGEPAGDAYTSVRNRHKASAGQIESPMISPTQASKTLSNLMERSKRNKQKKPFDTPGSTPGGTLARSPILESGASGLDTIDGRQRHHHTNSSVDEYIAQPQPGLFTVVVFGSINMDMIAQTMSYPRRDVTMAAQSFRTKPGGKGANEAVAVARLETPVLMIGRVGDDLFGKRLLNDLLKESIDCRGIVVDISGSEEDSSQQVETGVSMIVVAEDNSGKNTIACLGANQHCGAAEILSADRYFQERMDIGILLLQNEVNMQAIVGVATIAHMHEKLVIYKAAPVFSETDVPSGLLSKISILCVNEFEAPILLGWRESGPFPLTNLAESRRAAVMLHHSKNIPIVIVMAPFGHVCYGYHDVISGWVGKMKTNASHGYVETETGRADEPQQDNPLAKPSDEEQIDDQTSKRAKMKRFTSSEFLSKLKKWKSSAIPPASRNSLLDSSGLIPDRTEFIIPPFKVKIVDMIGAADAAVGGLTAALAREYSLQHAMVWATCCGSLSLLSSGAQDSMPDVDTLNKFMQEKNIHVGKKLPDSTSNIWPVESSKEMKKHSELYEALVDGNHYKLRLELAKLKEDDTTENSGDGIFSRMIDFQGQTLLHIAVVFFDLAAVCLLLEHQFLCCTNIKDRYGLTPIDRAYEAWTIVREETQKKISRQILIVLIAAHLFRRATGKSDSSSDGKYAQSEFNEIVMLNLDKTIIASNQDLFRRNSQSKMNASRRSSSFSQGLPLEYLLLQMIFGDDSVGRDITLRAEETEQPQRSLACLFLRELCQLIVQTNMPYSKLATSIRKAITSDGLGTFHAAAYAGDGKLLRNLIDVKLWNVGDEPLVDAEGRTPLHLAAMAGSEQCCKQLLDWGLNIDQVDSSGCSAMKYCSDRDFHQLLMHLAKYRDIFVSYGHTPETTEFTKKLCADLKKRRLTTWIDTDIEQGTRWREAIQDAIRFSGCMLVILTKKWTESNYCKGEAGLALNMNKPILVLVPPVSQDQRVGRAAIPEAMRKTLSERQFFQDFSSYDTYDIGLTSLESVVTTMKPSWQEQEMVVSNESQTFDLKPIVFLPPSNPKSSVSPRSPDFIRSIKQKHIFLACGGEKIEGHFVETMKNAMLEKGLVVHIGVSGHNFPDLRKSILGCTTFVMVICEGDNQKFLQRMLQEAGSANKPIITVPYRIATKSEGGMGYTAASASHLRTVCFTDWMGSGFTSDAPVFREIFSRFADELDTLAGVTSTMNPWQEVSLAAKLTAVKKFSEQNAPLSERMSTMTSTHGSKSVDTGMATLQEKYVCRIGTIVPTDGKRAASAGNNTKSKPFRSQSEPSQKAGSRACSVS